MNLLEYKDGTKTLVIIKPMYHNVPINVPMGQRIGHYPTELRTAVRKHVRRHHKPPVLPRVKLSWRYWKERHKGSFQTIFDALKMCEVSGLEIDALQHCPYDSYGPAYLATMEKLIQIPTKRLSVSLKVGCDGEYGWPVMHQNETLRFLSALESSPRFCELDCWVTLPAVFAHVAVEFVRRTGMQGSLRLDGRVSSSVCKLSSLLQFSSLHTITITLNFHSRQRLNERTVMMGLATALGSNRSLRSLRLHILSCPESQVIYDALADGLTTNQTLTRLRIWSVPCHPEFLKRISSYTSLKLLHASWPSDEDLGRRVLTSLHYNTSLIEWTFPNSNYPSAKVPPEEAQIILRRNRMLDKVRRISKLSGPAELAAVLSGLTRCKSPGASPCAIFELVRRYFTGMV